MTVPEKSEHQGRFRYGDGESLYFRVRLRTEGKPPYGPEFLEIGTQPLDDGTYPLIESRVRKDRQCVIPSEKDAPEP